MSDVITREIEEKDLSALKSLIVEAFGEGWNLGRFNHGDVSFQALLEVYLSMFLNSAAFGRVAMVNGEVVGAILCSAKGEPEKFRWLQKDRAAYTLALLTMPEDERKDIAEHLSTSFQAIGRLLENGADAYDGSLEFIAVSKRAQGLKIGGTLWDEARVYFDSKNVKSIYLIADSSCNVGFYDHNGFIKTGVEEAVYNYTTGQRRFDIFVYEYKL